MKRFTLKRITALALALIMVLGLCPVTALAELVPEYYEMTTYYVAEDDGISNDELFAAYVQREVDESLGIEPPGFYRTSALKDGTLEKTLYEQLKVRLAAVASGEASSTLFNLPLESPVTLTAEELGVDAIFTTTNGTTLVDGVINAICEKLNLSLIYNCLLADCPLELYWHDKTSLPMGVGYQNDGGDCVVNSVSCHFYVAAEYSSTGATKTFVTDTTKTAAVKTALDNAKSIVDAYASKSDMEKLQGYKDTICSLVSYNTYAADSDNNVNYGNPWQMIWVFDMKSDTNVVCEGYAKAFQYLCDLTDFDGDIQCHTVTGTMSGGTGAGRYMWNVVTMDDGKNYLVDVTNCDSGPIGADNKLFMAYTADSADNNQTHTFTIGTQSVVFIYDTSMAGMFCDGYLALSETVYRYLSATATLTGSTEPLSPGDKITLTLRFDGTNIAGIDAALSFDSDVLQLVSAEELVTGGELYTDTLKFLLLNENAPINTATDVLKVTLKVKENVSAGAELSVSFKNIMVSNGNRDLDVGTATWKGSVAAPSDIAISEENFPDANFRSYVADNFDANGDGVLSTEEREAVSTIYCTRRNIGSLTGIEYFPELKTLTCYENQLGELDVSKNPALESLDFRDNQLSSIDVSNNPLLETLICEGNRLTALDVRNNPKLKSLYCSFNQLVTIDVSKNPAIERLSCFDNQLTSLDLSKNTALTSLWCYNNQLEMLDVSNNPLLETLICEGNRLTALDVRNNPKLKWLYCSFNQLASIDISRNFELKFLHCGTNQIKSLDVSKNTALISFDCAGNQLTTIDVSNNSKLEWLDCDSNQLTSIDVSNNPALETFVCQYNRLTSLDVSANTALLLFAGDYNRFSVVLDENKRFDLSTLPGSFDVSKAGNWTNGTVSGTILTVTDTSLPVTYDYDCGNNITLSFSLVSDTVTTGGDIAISEENFPDANFRSYVADNFDANGDGVLSTEEREAVSMIYCTMRNIGSLTGIEYFPELKALTCHANQLGELDVSKNPALESLDFSGNQLSSIDVSKNSELKTLHCAGNLLTTIDVSKNPQLISLYCFGNCLSNLDVSNNPMLERLECGDNRLTALDVSNNPKLKSLHCSLNQLATIDVSKNPAIEQLSCFDNQLTSLDVSKNTALTRLWCNNNQITELNVSNNLHLKEFNCTGNQLDSLDVSKNTALTSLFCDNNQLEMLDVSKNSQLTSLNCSGNRLSNLDVSNNPMLTYLYCSSNQITELNVSNNLHLKEFECAGNQVDSLDVSKNPLLEFLNCERNQLTALDIKNNPAISYLRCASNQLTSLDLSANTALSYLSCECNQLTALDISGNTNLETLHCNINQLTTIITCNNVALKTLSCYGNRLTNIDVSNSPELERLDCSINKLKSLDVSNNSMLELLNCSSNQLTSIDVSNNSALETFDCQYNQLTSLDVSANTALFFFEGDYNRFSVVLDENKQFDLSTLPGSFDVSKASNWTNGMVSGTILTVTDTSLPVTYDYDCGNDHAVRFTIQAENVWYGLAGPDGGMPETWIRGTLDAAMIYANELASGVAYIQLQDSLTTFEPLVFVSDKTTILDLNGYDIDRGLTQAVDDGNVITVNGTLTLCDTSENADTAPGKVTGGYGYYDVGGVLVKDGGTLNITGGAIADNRSEKGTGGMMVDGRGTVNMSGGVICGNKGYQTGGVFLASGGPEAPGIFNMSGGSITENERTTDNEYGAGGISVICEDSLFLSGSASITGNVKHCGYPSNIWLKGDSVIITGELSGSFGIGREFEEFDYLPTHLVAEGTADYAITAEDRAKFTSDNGHNVLLNSEGNQLMLAPGAYAVSFDLQGIEGSVDSQTILYGELVMQPDSPTTEDYAFLGWYKEPACENIWNFDTDIVTKTTVLYAKWGEKTDKDGLWCEDIAPQTYTGSAIKPMVRVYFRDKLLTEKVDYTLSYKNNTNAADCDSTKAPTITIKGKGNFSGTLTKTFTILPADIGSNLPIEEIYAAANDRGQKPKITVTVGNRKLSTKDMTVEYFDIENGGFSDADKVESCVGVGDWAIVVSGQGNYTGERTYLFHAVGADKLISKAKLSLSAKSITYDGNWHTPEVKVMIGKTELKEGEHYSVSYRDNHGVGTATVTVTGINGYVGTATTTFKITGIPMSKMKVEFLNKATGEYSTKAPSYTYTRAPIKMYEDAGDFRVYYDTKVNGETMRVELSPLEYSVSYQNNDRKGTATMLLTGKEAWGFTGSKKISFKINAYNILSGTEEFHVEMAESVPYMKGGAKPEPMITFNGEPLEVGVDYTISYKNNTAIADENSAKVPMITITGKGNFTGKRTVNFAIKGKKLSKTDLIVDDVVFSEKGLKAPKLTITDKDGKKLVAGKDYEKTLSYRCNGKEYANIGDIGVVDAGTEITVIVVGNGTTYTETAEKTFRVVKASLAKATVKVANQQYTGKPIIPDKSDITVTVNKDKVDPENFEIVSCTNNVNKGSATLTIRGVGENYGGFKTVKFKIDAKAMAWSNLQSTLFDLFT